MGKTAVCISILTSLIFICGISRGEDFCVSNSTELQTALTEAEANGEDDVIRVVQGTFNGNFIYSSYEGMNISLLGGTPQDVRAE
ncbi:hypothetical protein AMJ44_12325 [candidate division WOR-1 bacterium DG_54_3]|jgi:hypothetical protein|uniref:DUF1565 domain-containing protein n=1 Tax=candidate division WOR-1 bacterium DG_54_3 TaxID=1703775 RepID=A0A0S7XQG9_UNCSA|nr:MAG: hypothetical protein AMJ44_12325 [candidate division WOR-1 bacterium DG_54_3]